MKITLLFVDDDRLLVKSAVRYMQKLQPEWEFLIAYSGAKAKALFSTNSADAVVLDLDLPDRDGMEMLSEFKFSNPKLPVIVLSDHDTDDLRGEAAVRGASAFFSKPFPPLALVNNLESAVSTIREIIQSWDTLREEMSEAWEITVPPVPRGGWALGQKNQPRP